MSSTIAKSSCAALSGYWFAIASFLEVERTVHRTQNLVARHSEDSATTDCGYDVLTRCRGAP